MSNLLRIFNRRRRSSSSSSGGGSNSSVRSSIYLLSSGDVGEVLQGSLWRHSQVDGHLVVNITQPTVH